MPPRTVTKRKAVAEDPRQRKLVVRPRMPATPCSAKSMVVTAAVPLPRNDATHIVTPPSTPTTAPVAGPVAPGAVTAGTQHLSGHNIPSTPETAPVAGPVAPGADAAGTHGADRAEPSPHQSPPHRDLTVVRNIRDQMHWSDSNIQRCKDPVAAMDRIIASAKATGSISTTFSGVCAETVALNVIDASFERMCKRRLPHPNHLYSIDVCGECQSEQRVLPHGPQCIFGSIDQFQSESLQEKLKLEPQPWCPDRLMSMVLEPGAVGLEGNCLVHRKRCRLKRSGGHLGGIPCVDYTTWGKARQLNGPSAILVLMFMAFRILLKESWAVVENVVGFPQELLERYLGRWYYY